ncbi:MAG: hypothetical protein HPY50_05630 [Firmicutes bacterium]|nr:hypothetical protein [Bacillota bacterium]
MVFQGKMNRKAYRAVLWVIIVLVIISFLMTIVVPLVAAPPPTDAPTAAVPPPIEAGLFDALAAWLMQPLVSGVLIAAGISGLGLEIFALNWGLPGTAGVISLTLFFIGSFLAGIANLWAIALFVLGMALILSELLVSPGRLAAGIGGALLLAAAVVLASPSAILAAVYLAAGSVTAVLVLLCAFKVIDLEAIWGRIRHGKSSSV